MPDEWLVDAGRPAAPSTARQAYVDVLLARVGRAGRLARRGGGGPCRIRMSGPCCGSCPGSSAASTSTSACSSTAGAGLPRRRRSRSDLTGPRALDPTLDVEAVGQHLSRCWRLCAGDASAGANGRRSAGERFRWLVAPRSTVVQPSPVHTGLTDDPAAELADLFDRMVEPSAPGPPAPVGAALPARPTRLPWQGGR